jgi:hypothetical protein
MVYVAKASTKGEGAVWTKIFEEGLTNGKWAVEKFISNKGQITITSTRVTARRAPSSTTGAVKSACLAVLPLFLPLEQI